MNKREYRTLASEGLLNKVVFMIEQMLSDVQVLLIQVRNLLKEDEDSE